MIDLLSKLLFEGAHWSFVWEIVLRSMMMFFFILIVLRLSGRRGVRQLTLFEVAIILGLGSAAGDPMFQEDIPVAYAIVVLFTVIVFYKILTWIASRSDVITRLLEGKPMVIVEHGMFHIEGNKKSDFSQNEFFSELRNQSVEHLGQVRIALLEVDGTLSILRYAPKDVKYGLPLFLDAHKEVVPEHQAPPFACMFCGNIVMRKVKHKEACLRCGHKHWTLAINTPPVA